MILCDQPRPLRGSPVRAGLQFPFPQPGVGMGAGWVAVWVYGCLPRLVPEPRLQTCRGVSVSEASNGAPGLGKLLPRKFCSCVGRSAHRPPRMVAVPAGIPPSQGHGSLGGAMEVLHVRQVEDKGRILTSYQFDTWLAYFANSRTTYAHVRTYTFRWFTRVGYLCCLDGQGIRSCQLRRSTRNVEQHQSLAGFSLRRQGLSQLTLGQRW